MFQEFVFLKKNTYEFSTYEVYLQYLGIQAWEVAVDLDPGHALIQEVQFIWIDLVESYQKTEKEAGVLDTHIQEKDDVVLPVYSCDVVDPGPEVLDINITGQVLVTLLEVTDVLAVRVGAEVAAEVGVGQGPDKRNGRLEYMGPRTFKIWNS